MDIATTKIGDFTVHAVEDGYFKRSPMEMFPTSDPAVWTVGAPGIGEDGLLRVTLGCFVIEGPDGVTLVDTGGGSMTPPGGGRAGDLPAALAHLGVQPTDVALVVHTHLHPDHTGGDVVDEAPRFPNAVYVVHEQELAYWFDESYPNRERGRAPFREIVDLGVYRTVKGAAEVAAHLEVMETFGHTPGHMSVVLSSGNERLLIGGDVSHSPLQAAHPEWSIAFDMDREGAAATRSQVFALLADSATTFAAGHYPRPGLGSIATSGDAYRFDSMPATT